MKREQNGNVVQRRFYDGLDFIVMVRGSVKQLLAYSICQPEPAWGKQESETRAERDSIIVLDV